VQCTWTRVGRAEAEGVGKSIRGVEERKEERGVGMRVLGIPINSEGVSC